MSKLKSIKATYSDAVAKRLFGTPSAAKATAAKILTARREGSESFVIGGKVYRSVPVQTPAARKK